MKKLLIVLMACILLAGCSPKKEEGNKKTTSYTPKEVQAIFEREGYEIDAAEDKANNVAFVNIASDEVTLFNMVIKKDGKVTSKSFASFDDNSYFWNDDVGAKISAVIALKIRKQSMIQAAGIWK